MKPFTKHNGLVVPLVRANIDTDAIMPKQFLKSIKRTGYGEFIFDEWRYLDHGEPGMDCSKRPLNQDFSLNQSRYQGASILLTGANFGCGSSREHAPWGLYEYGFRVIIAPSFADIFFNNCAKNGLLLVSLDQKKVNTLIQEVESNPSYALTVDLEDQQVITPKGESLKFDIDPAIKQKLLGGLDDIATTLQYSDMIKAFENKHKQKQPWLFGRWNR